MTDFAKLYRNDEYGQILVMKDTDDEGNPCIYFFVEKNEILCRIGANFDDTNEGWEKRDEGFESIDEGKAIESVKSLIEYFNEDEDD